MESIDRDSVGSSSSSSCWPIFSRPLLDSPSFSAADEAPAELPTCDRDLDDEDDNNSPTKLRLFDQQNVAPEPRSMPISPPKALLKPVLLTNQGENEPQVMRSAGGGDSQPDSCEAEPPPAARRARRKSAMLASSTIAQIVNDAADDSMTDFLGQSSSAGKSAAAKAKSRRRSSVGRGILKDASNAAVTSDETSADVHLAVETVTTTVESAEPSGIAGTTAADDDFVVPAAVGPLRRSKRSRRAPKKPSAAAAKKQNNTVPEFAEIIRPDGIRPILRRRSRLSIFGQAAVNRAIETLNSRPKPRIQFREAPPVVIDITPRQEKVVGHWKMPPPDEVGGVTLKLVYDSDGNRLAAIEQPVFDSTAGSSDATVAVGTEPLDRKPAAPRRNNPPRPRRDTLFVVSSSRRPSSTSIPSSISSLDDGQPLSPGYRQKRRARRSSNFVRDHPYSEFPRMTRDSEVFQSSAGSDSSALPTPVDKQFTCETLADDRVGVVFTLAPPAPATEDAKEVVPPSTEPVQNAISQLPTGGKRKPPQQRKRQTPSPATGKVYSLFGQSPSTTTTTESPAVAEEAQPEQETSIVTVIDEQQPMASIGSSRSNAIEVETICCDDSPVFAEERGSAAAGRASSSEKPPKPHNWLAAAAAAKRQQQKPPVEPEPEEQRPRSRQQQSQERRPPSRQSDETTVKPGGSKKSTPKQQSNTDTAVNVDAADAISTGSPARRYNLRQRTALVVKAASPPPNALPESKPQQQRGRRKSMAVAAVNPGAPLAAIFDAAAAAKPPIKKRAGGNGKGSNSTAAAAAAGNAAKRLRTIIDLEAEEDVEETDPKPIQRITPAIRVPPPITTYKLGLEARDLYNVYSVPHALANSPSTSTVHHELCLGRLTLLQHNVSLLPPTFVNAAASVPTRTDSCADDDGVQPTPTHMPFEQAVGASYISNRTVVSQLCDDDVVVTSSSGCTGRQALALCQEQVAGSSSGSEQMWTELFAPRQRAQLVVYSAAAREVHQWMQRFKARLTASTTATARATSRSPNVTKRRLSRALRRVASSSEDESDDEAGGDDSLPNLLLLSGPNGHGKTAMVHALARTEGLNVLEVSSNAVRSAGVLKTQLRGAVHSHRVHDGRQQQQPGQILQAFSRNKMQLQRETSVSSSSCGDADTDEDGVSAPGTPTRATHTGNNGDRPTTPRRQRDRFNVILLDEVDIDFEQEESGGQQQSSSFWSVIGWLAEHCRVPVIMTCNAAGDTLRKLNRIESARFTHVQHDIDEAHVESYVVYLQAMCLVGGRTLCSRRQLHRLFTELKRDLRKTILHLQYVLGESSTEDGLAARDCSGLDVDWLLPGRGIQPAPSPTNNSTLHSQQLYEQSIARDWLRTKMRTMDNAADDAAAAGSWSTAEWLPATSELKQALAAQQREYIQPPYSSAADALLQLSASLPSVDAATDAASGQAATMRAAGDARFNADDWSTYTLYTLPACVNMHRSDQLRAAAFVKSRRHHRYTPWLSTAGLDVLQPVAGALGLLPDNRLLLAPVTAANVSHQSDWMDTEEDSNDNDSQMMKRDQPATTADDSVGDFVN